MFQNGYWFMDIGSVIQFSLSCGCTAICFKALSPLLVPSLALRDEAARTLGRKPVVFSAAVHGKLFRNMPTGANLPSRMCIALTF